MLTPAFEIQQTDEFLSVVIRAPFANLAESEFYVDQCNFKFYAKPYFLRLTFPGPVVEDGRETASYDTDTASFTIQVPKANHGEYFPDLDLQTKLLAPSGEHSAKQPTIEVLDDEENDDVAYDDADEAENIDSFDWEIEQEPHTEVEISIDGPKYGFANKRCGVLKRLTSELNEVIDLKDVDTTSISERRLLRKADEDFHFAKDHYWADLFESEEIEHFLQCHTKWSDELMKTDQLSIEFSDYEKEILRKLPRKEYLLDASEKRCAMLGLVDILFAYAYDQRTTEGENTVESGWTIAKLSATLSWFETYTNPNDVQLACFRRSLCYPLHRSWQLSEKIWNDVLDILTVGRRLVVKCLIDIRRLFIETGDLRYILNDLYIDDYCTWLQHVSDKKLSALADTMRKVTIAKDDVGFDLDSLELAGRLAVDGVDDDGNSSSDEDTSTSSSSEPVDSDDESSVSSGISSSTDDELKPDTPVSGAANRPNADSLLGDGVRLVNETGKSVESDVGSECVASREEIANSLQEEFVSLSVSDVGQPAAAVSHCDDTPS